jgi:hypothetical protein
MVSSSLMRRARTLSVGETLRLSPQEWVRVPPGFTASPRSRLPGATTYREDRPERPLVIRQSSERVVVARERYHPRYHPAKHAVADVLPAPVAAGVGRVGAALGSTHSR